MAVFETKSLPSYPKWRPTIGNGHIGTAVHSNVVCMNGLFNGVLTQSRRAAVPSTVGWNISGVEPVQNYERSYVLNTTEGIYSEISTGSDFIFSQKLYAHRVLTRLFVAEVDLVLSKLPSVDCLIIENNKWKDTDAILFTDVPSGLQDVIYKVGQVRYPETSTANPQVVHVLYDVVPDKLCLSDSSLKIRWFFLTAIGVSKAEVFDAYNQGVQLLKEDKLRESHANIWLEFWNNGRIEIQGNDTIARAVYGSMYYLFSSLPFQEDTTNPFIGLSPSGLPYGYDSGEYWGHVFWDQETWMYPPVLMLHSDVARLILQTRLKTADAAKQHAIQSKDRGLRYPWESAVTGEEVCGWNISAKYEIHITGDIGLAIRQYLYSTNNSILAEGFEDILIGISDFWLGRLVYNQSKDLYEIYNVQSPDEDHFPINNSAYTNTMAKISLATANKYAYKGMLSSIIDQIYIPYDSVLDYHPAFDGYTNGEIVKQADVILMGYPLLFKMPTDVRKNDLLFYEKATRNDGPAMTSSMFSIGWLEMGDLTRAMQSFNKNFLFIRNSFQVWSETVLGSGAANFITGMGGFLQNILFGFGGLRVQFDRLELNPVIPVGTSGFNIVGLDYRGSSLNLLVSKDSLSVSITQQEPWADKLYLFVKSSHSKYELFVGKMITFPLGPAYITYRQSSTSFE